MGWGRYYSRSSRRRGGGGGWGRNDWNNGNHEDWIQCPSCAKTWVREGRQVENQPFCVKCGARYRELQPNAVGNMLAKLPPMQRAAIQLLAPALTQKVDDAKIDAADLQGAIRQACDAQGRESRAAARLMRLRGEVAVAERELAEATAARQDAEKRRNTAQNAVDTGTVAAGISEAGGGSAPGAGAGETASMDVGEGGEGVQQPGASGAAATAETPSFQETWDPEVSAATTTLLSAVPSGKRKLLEVIIEGALDTSSGGDEKGKKPKQALDADMKSAISALLRSNAFR